jgi:hypothetical protein
MVELNLVEMNLEPSGIRRILIWLLGSICFLVFKEFASLYPALRFRGEDLLPVLGSYRASCLIAFEYHGTVSFLHRYDIMNKYICNGSPRKCGELKYNLKECKRVIIL